MKDDYSIIDKILEDIELTQIPVEFIAAAKVEYEDGIIKLVSSNDLKKIASSDLSYEEQGIVEIKLWINIDLVKHRVNAIVKNILTEAAL